MARRALIVAGAAGSDATAAGVLAQMGFAGTVHAASVDEALPHVQHDRFDLLIVPMSEMQGPQLMMLDRAVRRADGTFIIGTATKADPELMLRALRSGIHEFLLLPLDSTELTAAVDRLMRRNQADTREGKVIAVYSGKGGLGCTTIAVNLAHALASAKPEGGVALVDMVAASGDVRIHLNLNPAYDRSDLVRKLDRIDTQLLRSVLTECEGGLWVLPGTEAGELESPLEASAANVIIDQLKQDFPFAVLDCEHQLSAGTLAALEVADRILLVTELSVAALRSTQRTLAVARRTGYPDDKIKVVVNRYQSGEALSPADAQDALKREIFWKIPNDYRTAAAALTKGVPIARYGSGSKLAASFRQLAGELRGERGASSRNGARPGGRPGIARLFGRTRNRS